MSKICNNCSTGKMPSTVPYQVLKDFKESVKGIVLKWFIICLILVILLIGTNIAWMIYANSFNDVITTEEIVVEAEGDGIANFIGQDGNIYNGENNGEKNN